MMAEPNNPESHSDIEFQEGVSAGYDAAVDELREQLYEEGFDPDEIEDELDYDPAPRRHRRRGRRHVRRYDPAPRRRRQRRRGAPGKRRRARRGAGPRLKAYYQRIRKKGALAKFRKFVMPGAALGTFWLSYSANAKARGMKVMDALKADLESWDGNKVWEKIQANPVPAIGAIGLPIVKKTVPQLNKGFMGVITDLVQGICTGSLATQVIDKPAAAGGQGNENNPGRDIVSRFKPDPASAPAGWKNPLLGV